MDPPLPGFGCQNSPEEGSRGSRDERGSFDSKGASGNDSTCNAQRYDKDYKTDDNAGAKEDGTGEGRKPEEMGGRYGSTGQTTPASSQSLLQSVRQGAANMIAPVS